MSELWGNREIQRGLALCHLKGKFLFEVLPDEFPQGKLTWVEMQLWDKWLQQLKEK